MHLLPTLIRSALQASNTYPSPVVSAWPATAPAAKTASLWQAERR